MAILKSTQIFGDLYVSKETKLASIKTTEPIEIEFTGDATGTVSTDLSKPIQAHISIPAIAEMKKQLQRQKQELNEIRKRL